MASYVVGDLHGEFDLLLETLKSLNFNYAEDILYCTGDLVDRGFDSYKCVQLLKEPWFKSVLGNHEQFIIDYMEEDRFSRKNSLVRNHFAEGGKWFYYLADEQMLEVYNLVKALPYYIELQVLDKKVAIVHADCDSDWNSFKAAIDNENKDTKHRCIWSRVTVRAPIELIEPLTNIDYVFIGHTPVENSINKLNRIFIDTGAYSTQKLTILKIEDFILNLNKK